MPFPFSYVCDLLERLDNNLRARAGQRHGDTIVTEWFDGHRAQIGRDDTNGEAFLSTLLPEKRTDRVYRIQAVRLQRIVGRAQSLGQSRLPDLGRWQYPGLGIDLGDCVENILNQTPNPPGSNDVSVEQVDLVLHTVAANCHFSSPSVRAAKRKCKPLLGLEDLYRRLSPRDAKWFTRLVLKDFGPVKLNDHLVCRSYHELLPLILTIQDNFAVAIETLRHYRETARVIDGPLTRDNLVQHLRPTLGVKVGRQNWEKGRSIKHALSMSRGRMSCEQKMDGEYCQIHIDLSKASGQRIQIFSKSGKDSTSDRAQLHTAICNSLGVGAPSCSIKSSCILEGELVVWSDRDNKILDFHKIRKHVSRSGVRIGTEQDSQRHPWEHLMIVYFDALMIDGESLLAARQSERFQRLRNIVTTVPGRSELVKRDMIDCGQRMAASHLRNIFARCITGRHEGLVLKPDEPYFNFSTSKRRYASCCIKLKKEYIGNFGDVGDFAVLGARYDAVKAREYNIPNLRYTHFFIGCMENKADVTRWNETPKFVVTSVVELNQKQLKAFLRFVNPAYVEKGEEPPYQLRIERGIDNGKKPTFFFRDPPVFDIRCFSFEKAGNTGFWSPRFPVVSKIHSDRTYQDVLSFTELQDMAKREKEATAPADSQEVLEWIARLESADPRGIPFDASSQLSGSLISMTPLSTPARSSGPSQLTPRAVSCSQPVPSSSPRRSRRIPVDGSNAPPTPPRSSAVEQDEATNGVPSSNLPQTGSPGRPGKRRLASPTKSPRRTKAQKRGDDSTQSFQIASQQQPASQLKARQPLSIISVNSSLRSFSSIPGDSLCIRASFISAGPDKRRGLSQASVVTASFAESTAPRVIVETPRPSQQQPSSVPDAPRCQHCPSDCSLASASILLAPCIARMPYVVEDLLGMHGVTEFITDPDEWLRQEASSTPSGTQHANPRRKKLVFVERRREEATVAFLKQVEESGVGEDGNRLRPWASVYDWRVLEELKKLGGMDGQGEQVPDSRFDMMSSRSIWKKFWVALV